MPVGNITFIPFSAHIEPAIAAAILLYINIPVVAGADDIPVLLPLTGCETAGAGRVAITLFIDKQRLKEKINLLLIAVEIIAARLMNFL